MSQIDRSQPWNRLVHFDRHQRPTRPLAAAATSSLTPVGGEPQHGAARPSILVVDEFPFNHELLRGATGEHFELRSAFTGSEALAEAAACPPDLLLLESALPDMPGVEVLRRLQRDAATQGVPAILVGAEGVEEEAVALDCGAADFIAKPFHLPIVLARVRTQLRLAEQARLLERLGSIDALTGIANRRRLDDAVAGEWRRAQRSGRPITFGLIDIDHFKRFNDRYGHLAGDRCLEQVARALADSLHRPGDLTGRYGGEEFGVVLPGLDPSGAATVGDLLRDAVLQLNIPHAASRTARTVTVSIGLGTALTAEWNQTSELVSLADSALYRAKRAGRNRVVQAVLEPPPRARLLGRQSHRPLQRVAQAR